MTWTRRSFIKAAGVTGGVCILELALPLRTICGSEEDVLSDNETIDTAFIGLGHYGEGVGRILSKIWKSRNPVSLFHLSYQNPLSELNISQLETFRGSFQRQCGPFSKIWKNRRVTDRAIFDEVKPLVESLQGKDLVFLACDELNEAWEIVRTSALAVDPILLVTLLPRPSITQHPIIRQNEALLKAPPLEAVPSYWTPVSSVLGSLVNPGLIGVDLADLKSVVAGKSGNLDVLQTDYVSFDEELENWTKHMPGHDLSRRFVILEQCCRLSIELVHKLADKVGNKSLEIYYSAVNSGIPSEEVQVTMLQAD